MLQYHSGDKYATAKTEARVKEYKVTGFPTMVFNGDTRQIGASSAESSYQKYSEIINRALAQSSAVAIEASAVSAAGKISLDVKVSNTSAGEITAAKLMAVVYEDVGSEAHHYVVRDILPPFEIASLPPGQQKTANLDTGLSASPANMKAVVFLQSQSGKVFQSTVTDISVAVTASLPSPTSPSTPEPTTVPPTYAARQVNLATDGSSWSGTGASGSIYQSFVPQASELNMVDLLLRAGGYFPAEGFNSTVRIRQGTPSGTVMGAASALIPAQYTGVQMTVRFSFGQGIQLVAADTYVIEWATPGGGILSWMGSRANPYAMGTAFGPSGTPIEGVDLVFVTY